MQRVNDTESKEGADRAADQLGFIKGLNIIFVTFFTLLGVIVLGFCIVNYLGYEELRDKHDALASQASVNFVFSQGQEEILFRNNERIFNLQNYVDELVSRRVNELLQNQTEFRNYVNARVSTNEDNLALALNAESVKMRADAAADISAYEQRTMLYVDQLKKEAAGNTVQQISSLTPGLVQKELANFRETDIDSLTNSKVFTFKNSKRMNNLNINIDEVGVQLETFKSSGPIPLLIKAQRLGVNVDEPQHSIHTNGKIMGEEDVCTKDRCLNTIPLNDAFSVGADNSIKSRDGIIFLNSAGRLGVLSAPSDVIEEKLHVFGKIKGSVDVCSDAVCLSKLNTDIANIGFTKDSSGVIKSTDSTNSVKIVSGKVAIGLSGNPTQALHVGGNVNADAYCVGGSLCLDGSALKPSFVSALDNSLISSVFGNVFITSGERVGLGTNAPLEKLEVKSGKVRADGYCFPESTERCLAFSSQSLTLSNSNFKVTTYPSENQRSTLTVSHIAQVDQQIATHVPGGNCAGQTIAITFWKNNILFCDLVDNKWKYVQGYLPDRKSVV